MSLDLSHHRLRLMYLILISLQRYWEMRSGETIRQADSWTSMRVNDLGAWGTQNDFVTNPRDNSTREYLRRTPLFSRAPPGSGGLRSASAASLRPLRFGRFASAASRLLRTPPIPCAGHAQTSVPPPQRLSLQPSAAPVCEKSPRHAHPPTASPFLTTATKRTRKNPTQAPLPAVPHQKIPQRGEGSHVSMRPHITNA
jgi:hypothetical protein